MKSRALIHSFPMAAVSCLAFAVFFVCIAGVRSSLADEPSSAGAASAPLEKTPISLPPPAEHQKAPSAKSLFLDGAAKLLIILAAVFALFWFLKRFQSPSFAAPARGGEFEVAALTGLTAKSRLALVRFGSRLLLLAVAPDRTEKIAETSDPDEIARILSSLKRKGTEK